MSVKFPALLFSQMCNLVFCSSDPLRSCPMMASCPPWGPGKTSLETQPREVRVSSLRNVGRVESLLTVCDELETILDRTLIAGEKETTLFIPICAIPDGSVRDSPTNNHVCVLVVNSDARIRPADMGCQWTLALVTLVCIVPVVKVSNGCWRRQGKFLQGSPCTFFSVDEPRNLKQFHVPFFHRPTKRASS